jgi:hypothetical protein
MSYELVAILVTTGFKSALLIVAGVLLFRTYQKMETDDSAVMFPSGASSTR